jgi:DNA invertase Pin-like site-specific DNA recombinase
MIYGYARVSTDGQTLDAQMAALADAGAKKVFWEKVSGAKADNRPELCRLIKSIGVGDIVVVTRLDRLARSVRDLLNILAVISDTGASFRSLGDAWADTTTPHGRLLVTLLGGIAEFERELIVSRTQEGRRRAVRRGKRMGRPPALTPFQREEIREALSQETATAAELSRRYGVSKATIGRLRP